MVAIRVWVKCMKSKANISVPRAHSHVFPNRSLQRTYSAGSISTPNRVPMNRQPKGFMPNTRIPKEMICFPKGGWVFS